MKLKGDAIQAIEEFLSDFPDATLVRGRADFECGAVVDLQCVTPDALYVAVVNARGVFRVEVSLTEGVWEAECPCRESVNCSHVVATMLALLQAGNDGSGISRPKPRSTPQVQRVRWDTKGTTPARSAPRSVAQPPQTPLSARLVAHVGRDLRQDEARFVREVQGSFATSRTGPFTERHLGLLVGRTGECDHWKPLELWRRFPATDFDFWLHIAWELNRRQWAIPPFMAPITDLSLIEPVVRAWERDKEIERWKGRFREVGQLAPPQEPGVVEFRLRIHPGGARLECRFDPQAEFGEMNEAQAKRLGGRLAEGSLVANPASGMLWDLTYDPWTSEEWWVLDYDDEEALETLDRLLRLSLPHDRVVLADGSPLPRHPEPLRLELRVPGTPEDDYELVLARPEGPPPSSIFCILPGHPPLYLTADGLFGGPPLTVLGEEVCQRIPAPALETAEGLRFLHAAGLPLPAHLAQKVRTVPVVVTVFGEVKPPYPGAKAEDVVLKVIARAPGIKPERLSPAGWEPSREHKAERAPKLPGDPILVHDPAAKRHFPRVIEDLGDLKFGGYHGGWYLRLTRKTPELLASWLASLPPDIEVSLDPQLATLRDEPVSGSVSLDVMEAGVDWFDLKVALNVSDDTLTPEELKLLLNARGGFVRLAGKGWRRLRYDLTPQDDEQLARLGLDAREFSSEPQRFHALQLVDDSAKRFLAPERIQQIQRRAGELKTRVSPPVPPGIRAELRPYQTDGFHFLAYLTANRFGGVLADDMGLGKTLQTLAWLAWLRDNPAATGGVPASPMPALVVCPKSVMDNWRSEVGRFYPGLRVRVWRGEPAADLAAVREAFDLIVINYAQLRFLSPGIAEVSWQAVVLDEAQYIKTPDSQTAQAARALKSEHRLALTGTPIENRLLDLWSILAFAMPGVLGHRAQFLRRFNAKDDPLARRRLAARVRPFLLRRTKSQVAKDLPDRVEEDLLCEMEGDQKTLYRAELKRARQMLLGLKTSQELNAQRFNILTSLLRLRQICCHPALVNADLRESESAKMAALEDLLEPLMEEGHKVLVFSQFVTMLDLLRETVEKRQWPHFYLAGDTENRGELVEQFQSAPGAAVFLISLKAGGFGLNLTAASYVVLFDPWWNPAVENQAIDRTHRIGQTSKVMAYRLLMRESIEEKIRALQRQKGVLADDVLGEERFSQSLTLDDLRFLFSE